MSDPPFALDPIRIKYKPWFGILGLAAGLFVLITGLALRGRGILLVNGGILLLVGLLQLVQPVVIIVEGEIQVRNLLGMTMKRFAFRPEDVTFEGLKIFVAGQRVRAIAPWALEREPLEVFKRAVEGQQAAGAFD